MSEVMTKNQQKPLSERKKKYGIKSSSVGTYGNSRLMLGRQDSNLDKKASKTSVLPLDDTPALYVLCCCFKRSRSTENLVHAS